MIIYFVPQVLVYTNIAQRVYIFYILVDIAKFLSKNGIIYSPTPNITNVRGKKKKMMMVSKCCFIGFFHC